MIKINVKNKHKLLKNHYASIKDKINFSNIKKTFLYTNDKKYIDIVTYLEKNIKSIIIDEPSKLRLHIKNLTKDNVNFVKHRNKKCTSFTTQQNNENEFINALIDIFDYDNKIQKIDFAKDIGLITCPYCNREYIFKFYDSQEKGGIRTIAHLDHFYSQKDFPYLALSFYNLIPSCSICNSKFKNQKNFLDIPHLHPYEDDFNKNAKFSHFFDVPTHMNKHHSIYSKSRIKLILHSLTYKDIKTQNTINTFRLDDIYNEHKDIVLELIQKSHIYNESYINELLDKFEGSVFKNREDLLLLIRCGYVKDEDLHKRPLSKLIKDISEELELI